MADGSAVDSSEDHSASLMVVAIDGPAGSGKSTVAKLLARRTGLFYLDTGAMYRAVTLAALRQSIPVADSEAVAELAIRVDIELRADGSVYVDGVESTSEIRSPEVSGHVSVVAANQAVRQEMVERQRRWTRIRGGGVLEGRDIGTAVFPNADLKVYLTASPEIRAQRRAGESGAADVVATAEELAKRDAYDSGRTHDPLRQADDAWMLDTSDMSIDQVVEVLAAKVDEAQTALEQASGHGRD